MKKISVVLTLVALVTLSACGSKKPTASSSSKSSETTTSKTTKSSTTESSSTQAPAPTSAEQANTPTADQNDPSNAPEPAPENTTSAINITTKEQAIQRIRDVNNDFKDEFAFLEMKGSDYFVKEINPEWRANGGSGTVTFFLVTPQGAVTEVNSSGNPW